MTYDKRAADKWQIDKHIPIVVILGIVLQTATFVWWAATLESRVQVLEARRVESSAITDTLPERITRLEVQQTYTNTLLQELLRTTKLGNK